jgi:hypothetical protein
MPPGLIGSTFRDGFFAIGLGEQNWMRAALGWWLA